ncbi:hypothetical protein D3C72_2170160 [compost metagenome]
MLPMRKQIADNWNGGILPDAAVNSARSDHIKIAVAPINVALNFMSYPLMRPLGEDRRG